MTSTCRHCGKRIVLVNWSMGPGWTHQPEGASFQDGMHVYCHVTRARECRHTWQTRGATFMGIRTVTRWCSCPGYVSQEES